MRTNKFLEEIAKRFDKLPAVVITDIEAVVSPMTDENRRRLWEVFLSEYTYKNPPNGADFSQLAKKHKIQLYPSKRQPEYVGYCRKCNVYFRNDLHFCPQCGNRQYSMAKLPNEQVKFIEIKPQCQMCGRYEEDIQGSVCNQYGQRASQNLEACKTCPCAICCHENYVYEHRHWEFMERKARGEFDGGFLPKVQFTQDVVGDDIPF